MWYIPDFYDSDCSEMMEEEEEKVVRSAPVSPSIPMTSPAPVTPSAPPSAPPSRCGHDTDSVASHPTAPSVAAYSFVPPLHLVPEASLDLRSPAMIRTMESSRAPSKSPKPFVSDPFYSRLDAFPFQVK